MAVIRRGLVACAVAVALGVVPGSAGGHARLADLGGFGYGEWNVRADEPVILASELRVCLDRPGRIEVLDMRMEYAVGGLRVDTFATLPMEEWLRISDMDLARPTLAEFGFTPGRVEIDRWCGPEDDDGSSVSRLVMLGVQFSKPADATARARNLLVAYRSGDRVYTARSELEMVLCEGDGSAEEWREECDSWSPERYEETVGRPHRSGW